MTKRPITFRLSSRHLILVSPFFKAALEGGWKEGSAINGEFQIDAEDWDVVALALVLNIIHGHHRRVPKQLPIELLTKVAAVVDYYQTHEIMRHWSMVWLEALGASNKATVGFKSGSKASRFCLLTISLGLKTCSRKLSSTSG